MSKLTRAGTIFFKGFIFICAWGATDQCQSRAGSKGTGMFLLFLEQKQPSRGREYLLELEPKANNYSL